MQRVKDIIRGFQMDEALAKIGNQPQDQSVVNHYVLGFAFDCDKESVLLVEKRKGPKLNHGKLNGIGGKVENGESAIEAMCREFKEEVGATVEAWKHIGDFCGPYWSIEVFSGAIQPIGGTVEVRSFNDVGEPLSFEDVDSVLEPSNLHWYAQNVPTMVAHAVMGFGKLSLVCD